jgi:quercetin dioxygenase-like cupin family protein
VTKGTRTVAIIFRKIRAKRVERFSARIRDEPSPGWTTLASGVEMRHMVGGYGTSIELYRMSPGSRFERHDHPFPELGILLSGKGRLLIADEERLLTEGDSFYIPGGAPHGFVVAPGAPVVVMNVTVPLPPYVSGPRSSDVLRLAKRSVRVDVGASEEPAPDRDRARRRPR